MENKWNLNQYVYGAELSVDDIINTIRVFEILKEKYPKDELMDDAIDVLRNEICNMFGGTIYSE
jgi:hypothetical protein